MYFGAYVREPILFELRRFCAWSGFRLVALICATCLSYLLSLGGMSYWPALASVPALALAWWSFYCGRCLTREITAQPKIVPVVASPLLKVNSVRIPAVSHLLVMEVANLIAGFALAIASGQLFHAQGFNLPQAAAVALFVFACPLVTTRISVALASNIQARFIEVLIANER